MFSDRSHHCEVDLVGQRLAFVYGSVFTLFIQNHTAHSFMAVDIGPFVSPLLTVPTQNTGAHSLMGIDIDPLVSCLHTNTTAHSFTGDR